MYDWVCEILHSSDGSGAGSPWSCSPRSGVLHTAVWGGLRWRAGWSKCRMMKITCIASPVGQLGQTLSACEHRFPFCSSSLLFLFLSLLLFSPPPSLLLLSLPSSPFLPLPHPPLLLPPSHLPWPPRPLRPELERYWCPCVPAGSWSPSLPPTRLSLLPAKVVSSYITPMGGLYWQWKHRTAH